MSRAFVERRLTSMGGEALGIAGIVRLPEGYFPAGEAMVFVVGEESPYAWQTNAIVVAGGEITGVIDRCPPEMLYPPASFIVPPPADDSDDVDPARRSGVEVIDDFLGALAAEDMTALAGLVNYQRIGCVVEQLGIGAPPLCEPGEPDGTLIDALAVAGCEGHYARVQDMEDRILPQLVDANWALYAVLDLGDLPPGQDDWMRGQYQLVLQDPLRAEYQQSIAFNFDEAGMTIIRYSCGIGHPAVLFWPGRTPEWILAPP